MTTSTGRGRARALLGAALLGAAACACALRLGAAGPETFRVLLATPRNAPEAIAMGEWIRSLDADVAFVGTDGDSAWFAATAATARLTLSGPAVDPVHARLGGGSTRSAPALFGFLAWEPAGDTTLLLDADGSRILVHDALYRTDLGKALDFIIAWVPSGADPRVTARTLMTYVATDVMHDAALLLALHAYDTAAADSIGALLEPVFSSVTRCEERLEVERALQPGALRLYYSPIVRVRCDAVRGFDAPFPALLARIVIGG